MRDRGGFEPVPGVVLGCNRLFHLAEGSVDRFRIHGRKQRVLRGEMVVDRPWQHADRCRDVPDGGPAIALGAKELGGVVENILASAIGAGGVQGQPVTSLREA